jgi:hypothetical protein
MHQRCLAPVLAPPLHGRWRSAASDIPPFIGIGRSLTVLILFPQFWFGEPTLGDYEGDAALDQSLS